LARFTYADPYGWLEDDTPEALAWGASEEALTRQYLQDWPHYQTVREQQSGTGFLYHSLSWSGPVPCGDRWLSVVPRQQAYPQLRVSTMPFGPGDIIFDPRVTMGQAALRGRRRCLVTRTMVEGELSTEGRVERLAAEFAVTPAAVRVRLQQMKIIPAR
jgi:hypothetical protein